MQNDEIKRIDIKEFREQGYLQELNRQFLHPLGLSLEVEVDENRNEKLGGVWDYREDEDGIYYDLANSNKLRIDKFIKNRNIIIEEWQKRSKIRKDKFGSEIEPIPTKEK